VLRRILVLRRACEAAGNWLCFAIVDRAATLQFVVSVTGQSSGGLNFEKQPPYKVLQIRAPDRPLVFSLLPFPQADPWAAAIFVDELDARRLKRSF
jgi:hypothetical protein